MITITRNLPEYRHETEIPTPYVRVDVDRLERNLDAMQSVCTANDVKLIPHIKTHKMVQVAKRQLERGAVGLTFAKLSEAEALLPAGPELIFLAHSIVDPLLAKRIARLAEQTGELILAVTSKAQGEALLEVVRASGLPQVTIAAAIDTGLHREGARSVEEFKEMADWIRSRKEFQFKAIYSHEGFCYGVDPAELDQTVEKIITQMSEWREAIGGGVELWPGCSVTGSKVAATGRVQAVRPGAYVFGDMNLCDKTKTYKEEEVALSVVASVVDKPEPELALLNAGSKVFSGDLSGQGHSGRIMEAPRYPVFKRNEEHGYIQGPEVRNFKIGQRLQFMVTHVCPVLNLADRVVAVRGEEVEIWPVEARGCVE